MTRANWNKAIKSCADPARAQHFLKLLSETNARTALEKASSERCAILAALFSGSQALSTLLVANPDLLDLLAPEQLQFPRRKQGLRKEVDSLIWPLLSSQDYTTGFKRIREFKQRQMLRIAARDLAHLGNVSEIVLEISDVADVCMESIWEICRQQLVERYGAPYSHDAEGRWYPTSSCVLGMGKLGGQELNYSSDVDVLFVYADEGAVFKEPQLQRGESSQGRKSASLRSPRATLKNHQFFNRLAEAFIAEIGRISPEGMLYRIDLRLRPEGDTGPLNRSLLGYESYYAQWGQTWERMMLIKARCVAGDESLAAEFLEMVQSFRYPRSINEGVLREVAAMKDRIENEVVKADELERNVKLGRGGIREIEFVVQALQLLHAGRQPFLQGSQTLPALEKLAQYELLKREDARALTDAYGFLRNVEHRLQMEDNRQTHTIPGDHDAQVRLASLMGFRSLKEFAAARETHTCNTRRTFDKVLKGEVPETLTQSPFPQHFEGAEEAWKKILAEHSFKDVDKAFRVLREFVEGPGYVHISERTKGLAFNLLPKMFALCPGKIERSRRSQPGLLAAPDKVQQPPLSDPDRVVTRLDSFIAAYGARSTLFELWNSNPAIFELLVKLFDRSEFLAELAIRTPDLVDELVTSGRLRQRKTAEETLADLRHGIEDEDQFLWLRRYHQAELMRIGLRDILGLADFEQYLVELSSLADACLQYALEVVLRKNKIKKAPFAIIGLGKLGGAEIDYGSDLDIIIVADSKAKNLPALAKVAIHLTELLSLRTEQGIIFHTDARLRPDGDKGLLVNTLEAYEEYYRRRAALWEIQSLTRTRPIAGDAGIGTQFQQVAAALTDFSRPNRSLAAYSPDWKQKIDQMRMRIEKERTPRGKNELAIKTGSGGLMDAEFIAQSLCLQHGWQEANTLRALERARDAKVLPDADLLITNYRRLRRVEGILRRWSYEGETVLPDDPAPYYRVSVRCGFDSPEDFRKAMAQCRNAIRGVYLKVFR
jgi:[glutamine synthetase] adenylyltransferase / [glutamine synthetase]-adenylyl-L-tyrosine phosphorylase